MRIPSARSIPTPIRIVLAAAVVVMCSAVSFLIALDVVNRGVAGIASGVGVVAGLYMFTVCRPEFLRFTQGQGVWVALLITYGIRLLIAAGSFFFEPARIVDFFIGMLSWKLGHDLVGGVVGQSPNALTFVITLIDALFQHALLVTLFGLVLAIVKPYAAKPEPEQRGFDVLRPDAL